MDTLISAAASGMRARMESLDLLANNISNATTTGFKADRESYRQYVSDLQEPSEFGKFALPVVESQWTDHSQGAFQQTGRPLDLSIQGNGFFALTSGSKTLLTRNGNFQLSSTGELRTQDGLTVRKRGGGEFKIDEKQPYAITPGGEFVQNGKSLGFLDVVSVSDQSRLTKQQGAVFALPAQQTPTLTPANSGVLQGTLETSNSNPSESAVKMVEILREFETLQRASTLGGDMNRKAIEEVSKVVG